MVYSDDGDEVEEHGITNQVKEELQDGEYIEYKSEPLEDAETQSKGREDIRCKVEPTEDTKMVTVEQEQAECSTVGWNARELVLNPGRPFPTRREVC